MLNGWKFQEGVFCSIAFTNYLPQVEVLFESIARFHPGARCVFLTLDNLAVARKVLENLAEVVSLEDLGFAREEIFRRETVYNTTEFATSFKPQFLRYLARDSELVTYVDPDIEFFAELRAPSNLSSADVLLTPHILGPIPDDGLLPSEDGISLAGIYNLGFIAIRRSAMPALDWWAEKLINDGDMRPGLSFTDQKAVDFFPALAEVGVVKDPGWNVAYWNFHEKKRQQRDGLVFFHYSGFLRSSLSAFSRHHEPAPRVRRGDVQWLDAMLTDYGTKCDLKNGTVGLEEVKGSGLLFDDFPWLRSFLAQNERASRGYRARPHEPEEFVDWLLDPGTGVAGSPIVPPLFAAIYVMEPQLEVVFPAVLSGDPYNSREFVRWLHHSTTATERILSVLEALGAANRALPTAETIYPVFSMDSSSVQRYGVNHIAYFSKDFGIGKFSQALAALIDLTGVPQQKYDLPNVIGGVRQGVEFQPTHGGGPLTYANSILAVNHDQVAGLVRSTGFLSTSGKRIGYWWWEVEGLTDEHLRAARHFNEIWVGSSFVKGLLEAKLDRPVRLVPIPVLDQRNPSAGKREAGFPENRIVFFPASSLLSDPARKNPLGVVRSFIEAFSPLDGAFLELHLVDSDREPFAHNGLTEVLRAIDGRTDIRVSTDRFSSEILDKKIEAADCFVSLHRSEGLGLNLLQAVNSGTYLIATGYGGNMDFMCFENSAVVGFHKEPIGPSPYYAGLGKWAEPDLAHAARAMREVLEQPELARNKACRLREKVKEQYGPRRVEEFFLEALNG